MPTYDDAVRKAFEASARYRQWSIDNDKEVVGLIYLQNGQFYSTDKVTKSDAPPNRSNVFWARPLVPGDALIVGAWHTHNPANEWTDPQDKEVFSYSKDGSDWDGYEGLIQGTKLANPFLTVVTPGGRFGVMNRGSTGLLVAKYHSDPSLLTVPQLTPKAVSGDTDISHTENQRRRPRGRTTKALRRGDITPFTRSSRIHPEPHASS